MAGRYLPTELQNDDGDVIYPHSSAEVIWMQDGRSVEALIGEKSSVIMTTGEIPVEQRQENNIYLFKKEDGTTQIEDYQGHKIYPRPDMLSTMEEVEANTTANKSVDALVVKELNSCLNFPNNQGHFYTDYQDGKYGFNTDPSRGADTFIPFKSEFIIEKIASMQNIESGANDHIQSIDLSSCPDYENYVLFKNLFPVQIYGAGGYWNGSNGRTGGSLTYTYDNNTGVLYVHFPHWNGHISSSFDIYYIH